MESQMSTEPVERLLDATASERPWSASVEAHLDAHPLPVDEAVVDRIAERLERRIRPRPSRAWLPLTVLAGLAAATAMLMLRSTASHPMSVQPEAPAKAVQIELRSEAAHVHRVCLLYTSPSPRDKRQSRMPSSA